MSRVPIALVVAAACSHSAPPPACPEPQTATVVANSPTPENPTTPVAVPTAAPTAPGPSGYNKPPQNVLDVLHAAASPRPLPDPTSSKLLLVSYVRYPSITQVAEPYLKLAGVRLEPRTRRKHDTPGGYGVAPCGQTLALVDVASTKEIKLQLPQGGCADAFSWSADGKHFAFRNTSHDAVELWVGDGTTGETHRMGTMKLNPMLGTGYSWLGDNKRLLVKLVPEGEGLPPAGDASSDGPSIQESLGQSGEFSTYEARDVLKSKHDEALFEYYATSQLATVDVASGKVTNLGKPAMYTGVGPSPDGKYLLVNRIAKPFSYAVTYQRFAYDVEVWDANSGALTKQLAKLPIADHVPVQGVPTGPRDFDWRSTEGAQLVWAEALDGGDWNQKVPNRDKILTLSAPFTAQPTELAKTEQRFAGYTWSEDRKVALLTDDDENKHWTRTWIVNVDDPKGKPNLLWDHSTDEKYKDPGNPVMKRLANGEYVMRQEGNTIYLDGEGATPTGDHPFLDKLDLSTKKSERLFVAGNDAIEYFFAFATDGTKRFLTWKQSPVQPPNAFMHTVGAADAQPVTHIPDPTPEVRKIKKKLIKYKRKDGVELSFTLYTPPNYVEGTKVPAILYAYPLDYANAAQAGQVSGSDLVFDVITDYRLLLLSGYAIIDNAAFPIVGDPKKAYDTYEEQLEMDAQAAVDTAVKTGVVDRDRIAVTGHSHGALMTANLIAHTTLFKAGAATSGSYNKTLTPFGFQSERRSVWKAPDVYKKVSPFFFADKIKLPLLIVHGMEDANPGTTPLQAEKLFEAIRGNGGTARLVMLPHEPHWYSAMESNEQLAYEELAWFDKYVKNWTPETKKPSVTGQR
ncbi:MAG: prolyl oligopeptidase family serine peptidase [Kofleriaceae bacterium]